MRRYLRSAVLVGWITFATVVATRAADPIDGAVASAAAVAVACALAARSGSKDDLALLNPAWSLAALLRGRLRITDLLPLWAAAAVGGLLLGMAGAAVVHRLPALSVTNRPDLLPAGVVLAVAGFVTAWLVTSASQSPALLVWAPALTTLVGAALLGGPFAAALNPAVLFGGGVAGIVDWTYAFVMTVVLLATALIGALASRYLDGRPIS
ncbi:MAG: hypothetical protein ACRDP1_08255 [Nocardioidaceae bacterium]